MTHLRIHLLGNFSITCDDAPLPAFASPRLQSFLAYLLLHSTAPQPRQQLAFQLWPDSREAQAYNNLRKAIHHLRHALPTPEQFLHIDAQTVQWRPQVACTVDIDEFTAKLRAADQVDTTDWAGQQASLEEAVARYGGDLLPGCYDEWIGPERERLRQCFLATLERLVWLSEDRRDYATAIHYAHQLLQHDPLQESAYHQLMRLHALNDDRAAALQVYHTCVTVLQRELGVEPGEALQQAHAHLLAASVPASLRPATSLAGTIRLVGRQPAWQMLRDAWQTARRTRAHFCLIQGEAGIGKTRLAEELLAWAARQGIVTATTRSYAAEGALAYAPVIEWLRTPALESTLATLDTVWLTEVARLLPELLVAHPTLPRPAPLTDQWQRQRLFEALARAFTSDGQAKLLVIDDLQWCDGETLAWLRYLLRFRHSNHAHPHPVLPLLIVGAARSEEVDADHPLTALLLDLRRNDEITELTLAPLNASETTELAVQVTTTPLVAETAQALYHQSEGNPLFVVEMVRAGMEDRRQKTEDRRQETENRGLETGEERKSLPSLPPKVHAVIQQRLNQLTPAARQLLGLAATMGRSFTFALLVAVEGGLETEVVQSLDELWRRGLVRTQGSNHYDFSHDRMREVAYATVSPAQRPLWHKRVAYALEALHANDLDPVSAQLAAHYEQAGRWGQAIAYYQQAATVEASILAHNKAVTYLDLGLALLRTQPFSGERIKQELTILLTKTFSLAIVQGFSVPDIAAVCAQIEMLLPQIDDAQLRFHAYQRLRGFYGAGGKVEQSEQYASHLLELAQQLDTPIYYLGAYQANGIVNLQLGHFSVGRHYMEQGEALYRNEEKGTVRHALSDTGMVGLRSNLGFTLWLLGYYDQARSKMTEAFALAETLADPFLITIVLFYASMVYRYNHAVEATAVAAERILALDKQYVFPLSHAAGLVSGGWALAQQGKLAQGIAQMRAGIDEMIAMRHTMFQTHRLAWLAEAQMQAQDWDAAGATLDEAFVMSDRSGQRSADAELHRLRGEWLLQSAGANPDRATEVATEAAFHQALTVARTQEAKSFELRAAISLCRLWQWQGKRTEAHGRLAAIYGWFTEGFDTADLQEAQALLAELALRQ